MDKHNSLFLVGKICKWEDSAATSLKYQKKNANLSTQNCIPSETAFKDEVEIDLFRQAKSEGIHFQLANATKKKC